MTVIARVADKEETTHAATQRHNVLAGRQYQHAVLPHDAQQLLRDAAMEDDGPRVGASANRTMAIDSAVRVIRNRWPDYFRPEVL